MQIGQDQIFSIGNSDPENKGVPKPLCFMEDNAAIGWPNRNLGERS
jgi:hypothetical protein